MADERPVPALLIPFVGVLAIHYIFLWRVCFDVNFLQYFCSMMEALKYFVESSIIAEATTIAVCIYKGESEWKYFYVLPVNEVSLYDNWRTQPGALEICRHGEARAVASKQKQTKFANVKLTILSRP